MTDIKYPFSVRTLSEDEGGGYIIEFPDLPGCVSDGDTIEEAILNGKAAVEDWIEACKKLGREIPAPSVAIDESEYSGKILARFPKYIHAKLAKKAEEEGVSINSLVQTFVAEGLGRREVLVAKSEQSYSLGVTGRTVPADPGFFPITRFELPRESFFRRREDSLGTLDDDQNIPYEVKKIFEDTIESTISNLHKYTKCLITSSVKEVSSQLKNEAQTIPKSKQSS